MRAGQHEEPKKGVTGENRRGKKGHQAPKTKRNKSGGGSHSRRGDRERRKGVTLAVLIRRKGEGRESGEAARRGTRDERTPSADPGLSGRRVRHPGIVGGVNDVLLTPGTSEGRSSCELDEMVDTGNRTGRVRTRIRRVRAVVVATLEKGAVRAGRDDRTDMTLRENRR